MAALLFNTTMNVIQAATWALRRLDYYVADSVVHLQPDNYQDPHTTAKILRERSTVLRSYMNRGWIVSGHAEVTELLREPRISNAVANNNFARRLLQSASGQKDIPFLEHPSLQQVDPPDHTRLRKLVSKGFVQKYIQSLAPTIERIVDELIDNIPSGQPFDLIESLARPLPAIVIAEMMGVPVSDRIYFEKWSSDLLGLAELSHPDRMGHGVHADIEMRAYMANLVEQKRANPGQDFISELIAAEEHGDKLTIDELKATAVLLLVAGHETTTRLIGSTVLLLLKHPQQMDKALNGENGLENAIEESLRVEPPVLFAPRVVAESFDYHNHSLRKGQIMLLSISAANRDPNVISDPDEFKVDRDDRSHISFGHGIHLCLGMTLARIESHIALRKLFEKFPQLTLAQDDPVWEDTPMFRGLTTLQLRP